MTASARRAAVVAAARGEFARQGYDGASTAGIARAAGCSEAVLYQHFASKLEMLQAVLGEMRQDRLGRIGRVEQPPAMGDLIEHALEDPSALEGLRVLLGAMAVADRDQDVADALVEQFASVRGIVERATRASQKAGATSADLDPGQVAWLWQGVLIAGLLRRAIRDDDVADGAVEAARLLSSLLAPDDEQTE